MLSKDSTGYIRWRPNHGPSGGGTANFVIQNSGPLQYVEFTLDNYAVQVLDAADIPVSIAIPSLQYSIYVYDLEAYILLE
jgi:hypothetical protein